MKLFIKTTQAYFSASSKKKKKRGKKPYIVNNYSYYVSSLFLYGLFSRKREVRWFQGTHTMTSSSVSESLVSGIGQYS